MGGKRGENVSDAKRRKVLELLDAKKKPKQVARAEKLSLSTVYKIKRTMLLRQPIDSYQSTQLQQHFDRLARTADVIAHHVQRMLRYRDNMDIEVYGNIIDGLQLWSKRTQGPLSEGTDPLKESRSQEAHPIDTYLAKSLFTHYEHEFGKVSFRTWGNIQIENVTEKIADNLKLLAHGGLKFCPTCPICDKIMK